MTQSLSSSQAQARPRGVWPGTRALHSGARTSSECNPPQFPRYRFLFAYSGHGIVVNDEGYILTSDAQNFSDTFNSISMATLRAMFQQDVVFGFHVLALINACYSGDFLRVSFGDKHFIPKYPGAHAITGGGSNELTWHDRTVGSGSVFFEKLYTALDGGVGRDGIVT